MSQQIPKIIHQLWKDESIPARWKEAAASVKKYHPDWDYKLWTDAALNEYVRSKHPDLYPVFTGFRKHIQRVDVFRYVLMHDIGGLYCDLDYQFIRPYDYSGCDLVIATEFDSACGDERDGIANFIFASKPAHQFWKDCLEDLIQNPPKPAESYHDIIPASGPAFISRIFESNKDKYENVRVEPRLIFNPYRLHNARSEVKQLLNNGISYGLHVGSSTWKERLNLPYIKQKLIKLFRL